MVGVQAVADCFIRQAHEVGDPITNLKLQKLVYYAQAWYAAFHDGEPLFPDRIEAWVHGPVCPAVYWRFRYFRWNPIGTDVPVPDLPADVIDHLQEVMAVYGGMSAVELERLTHQEDPWVITRGDLPADASSEEEIPVPLMADYYARKAEREMQHG